MANNAQAAILKTLDTTTPELDMGTSVDVSYPDETDMPVRVSPTDLRTNMQVVFFIDFLVDPRYGIGGLKISKEVSLILNHLGFLPYVLSFLIVVMHFKVYYREDRIFNRIISDISIALRETTLTISDSVETVEKVRVVSLSTTEITKII